VPCGIGQKASITFISVFALTPVCATNQTRLEFFEMVMLLDINRPSLLESGSGENNENLSEITLPVTKTDLVVNGNICCY
jgi:hypothetical protein